ncbi:MAG TPA: outer membrane beta-barrel protein [Kofleriaceae bacterium]|nr:outer membrane beta-barrel protein [Kofleriaceae bacterium]
MTKRSLFIGPLVGLLLAAPLHSARAEHVRLGGTIALLPIGQLHAEARDTSLTADTAVAVGFGGLFEVPLLTNVAVGFAPRLLLHVRGEDGEGSGKELDLAFRLIGNVPVASAVELYGFAAPGYSIIYVPDWPDGLANPAGFIFGFGAGVGFDLTSQFRLGVELGYQLGAQSVSEGGETLDVESSFLHLGVSAMARL